MDKSLFAYTEFDELFRDLAEVQEAVKKELARNSNPKIFDVISEDEEELASLPFTFIHSNEIFQRASLFCHSTENLFRLSENCGINGRHNLVERWKVR